MEFSKERFAKLSGLLTESVENEQEENDEMSEAEDCDEEVMEIDENFDIRKAIQNEVKRALLNRDAESVRYTSGQVFGKKSKLSLGQAIMGFPGIGFK